jgi:hypothetical protein
VWTGVSKRAGADPGSQIRLEPFQEPGSVPAKPLGSLGSLSGPRVAAGLAVGRPPATGSVTAAPDWQTAGDSRPPNATLILLELLSRLGLGRRVVDEGMREPAGVGGEGVQLGIR